MLHQPSPRLRDAKYGRAIGMHYVYLLRSESDPGRTYIGETQDLKARLRKHNEGGSPHTSKHRPWKLEVYVAFPKEGKAKEFERYLKTGSGRAFAKKCFW